MPIETTTDEDVIEVEATEVETEEVETEPEEVTDSEDTESEEPEEETEPADDGEVVVTLGDDETEEPEQTDGKPAPPWLKELRQSNREKDRIIRELERKVAAGVAPAPQAVVVGEKPTLEKADYDAEKFEKDLEEWHERKRKAEEQQREREQADKQVQAQWNTRIEAVTASAGKLKVEDHTEALEAFEATFSPVQQGIIVGGPEDPKNAALVRYALGKSPKKAAELAAIKDPIKFAFKIAQLETKLKVTPKKTAPAPDKPLRSAVAGAASVDNQLERLRKEAEKTGNHSKVIAYKNAQRLKKR